MLTMEGCTKKNYKPNGINKLIGRTP